MKKLQFGENKCHKLHVGRNKSICPDLHIDKWKVKNVDTVVAGESSLVDVYDGKHLIEDAKQEKYLGDIIDSSGKNGANISARVKKGHGKIKQIMGYLEDICYGKYHFTVAKILRKSLFINSILLNSEAWYTLNKSNIEELEKIDNILLKKIFDLPTSTPSAMVHLELGTIPIRFILMTRRLTFLQYILKEDQQSLISSFLMAQIENTVSGDWWETVLHDITELNLEYSLHDIKTMSTDSFKSIVKTAANIQAFKWLTDKKLSSKKIMYIQHPAFGMQGYLTSQTLSVEQRKFLMHARSRMLKLRLNYKNMHESDSCPLCSSSPIPSVDNYKDSQEHLLICSELSSNTEMMPDNLEYRDIFSDKVDRQEKVTLILEEKFRLRKKLEK